MILAEGVAAVAAEGAQHIEFCAQQLHLGAQVIGERIACDQSDIRQFFAALAGTDYDGMDPIAQGFARDWQAEVPAGFVFGFCP